MYYRNKVKIDRDRHFNPEKDVWTVQTYKDGVYSNSKYFPWPAPCADPEHYEFNRVVWARVREFKIERNKRHISLIDIKKRLISHQKRLDWVFGKQAEIKPHLVSPLLEKEWFCPEEDVTNDQVVRYDVLKYMNCYEEYADYLLTPYFIRRFYGRILARKAVHYNCKMITRHNVFSEEDFFEAKEKIFREKMYNRNIECGLRDSIVQSEFYDIKDDFLKELAAREGYNRVGRMRTLIYVHGRSHQDHLCSGLIDFSYRMTRELNFGRYWRGEKKIFPAPWDLCYYNWTSLHFSTHENDFFSFEEDNFKVVYTCLANGKRIVFDLKDPNHDIYKMNTEFDNKVKIVDNILERIYIFDYYLEPHSISRPLTIMQAKLPEMKWLKDDGQIIEFDESEDIERKNM